MTKGWQILEGLQDYLTWERKLQDARPYINGILLFSKSFDFPFTADDVRKYVIQKKQDGAKPGYVNKIITNLIALVDYCHLRGYLSGDFSHLRRLKERESKNPDPKKFIKPEEIQQILNFRREYSRPKFKKQMMWRDKRYLMLFKLMYYTGCRCGEAVKLKRGHVNLDDHSVTFYGTKNGDDRISALSQTLEDNLRIYLEGLKTDLLFPGEDTGRVIAEESVNRTFQRYAKMAGITRPLTVHMIRHSMISHCIRDGMSLPLVQQQVGHKNVATTYRYTHLDTTTLRQALQNFNPLEINNQNGEMVIKRLQQFIESLNLDKTKVSFSITQSDKSFVFEVAKD